MTDFFELHTRSAFSFLSSGSQPQAIAHRAADLGMAGAALIDRDTVAGAVRFHFEAKERGIKPIIGSGITLENGSLLSLIPMTLKGYQNLSRLITTIKLRNKKGEHFATREDIENHSGGLLCFTGGADGFMHQSIKTNRGQADLAWLKYVFEDRLYIELQRHHLRSEEAINQSLLGLAHKFRIPYFASNGACYADKTDRELFDVFTCIKNHCTIYEAGKILSENAERYLKPKAQMLSLFEDLPEAVEITADIAARVNFSMNELSYQFPDYPVPAGETMDSYLRKQAEEGVRERYRNKFQEKDDDVTPQKVLAQLDIELKLIERKKLAGYFLVVWDISQKAKNEGILSQGRGSAANSVACYSLGITAVEPVKNKLLFERFLSEKHENYPDIDIDLPSGDDRETLIQYVYEKYTRRGAAMTANVISYRGKSAIREVGKVFGFDEAALGQLSRINSHYETFQGEELDRRLKEEGFDPADSHRLRKFSELYTRILDFPRHLGQHSGGMVVSWGALDSIVPIEPATMVDRSIIQWDKDDCEDLKLVKIDLLGLGMMAVLRDSITLIHRHHDQHLDLYQIPDNDKTVYDTLQKADTVGMFQVESRAQIAFLPKTKPENFYDVAVQVAIIRPGPIAGKMLSSYIKRRQKLEPITYPHPSLEANLKRTLGVPLFQEQLLKISMELADFSGADAERLRRAMGFKRANEKLNELKASLYAGMERRGGIDKEAQDNIVNCVMAFSNYGFPESHAMSFAYLAYASAYFMVHYRACFTAAMLNNYPLGFYSAATLVKDAQRHDLHFIAMDINRSQYIFTVEDVAGDKQVRVGLKYVKGLRKETGEAIVTERNANGFYTSVEDLVRRMPGLNKREVRALSMAGALNFDGAIHRREALWQSELAIQPAGELFAETIDAPSNAPFLRRMEGLQLIETDLRKTGISIGKHPMAFIREEMTRRNILSAKDTLDLKKGEVVSVAGAVIIRQRPMTANNVVFITLEDETGHSNFVVMPDMFEKFRTVINQNDYLIIKGIFEERGMLKALYFESLNNYFTAAVAAHNFH